MELKGKKAPVQAGRKARPGAGRGETSEIVQRFKANPLVFIGTVVILLIVIVAFVLVPAFVPEAARSGTTDLTFGSYNKTPISYVPGNYLAQAYQNLASYYQSSIDSDSYLYMYYQIWQQAFNEAVVHVAVLDEMKRAGYTPPAGMVDREVAGLSQFRENGRFSAALYRSMDDTARMSLWREVRDSLATAKYLADITDLRVPAAETAFIKAMASPVRSFDLAAFPIDSYPDSEVAAFGSANAARFRQLHFSEITITASEEEARKVLAAIQDGTSSFEEAARLNSQDSNAERGGDMGQKMAYEFDTEIPDSAGRDQVLALAPGQLSSVVKVPSGWAVFRCEAAPVPVDTANSESLGKIRLYMLGFERGLVEDWLIARAESFGRDAAAAGFDETVQVYGIEKKSFGPLPLNYGDVDLFTVLDSSVTELGYYASTTESFWRTAFSSPVGSASRPLVLGDNIVVLYPREERVPEESVLESVDANYTGWWLAYTAENSLRNHFLNSDKLENNFYTAWSQLYFSE
ncbi:MAG: peptidylprolyl isomerase [Treponema sp.]|jgi:hypothetical protein|nr:peptidylprolyl isomerase [Treponema sp.]